MTADDDGALPPADPAEFPPQLQETLRRMSARGDGPVVDMSTGATVAEDGRLVTDAPADLVACMECARAIALGWWGAIARHFGEPGEPVCVLCGEGAAVLTAVQFFARAAVLVQQRTADGQRRSWRDDAVIGLGAARPGL
jgi:hypothetical protein